MWVESACVPAAMPSPAPHMHTCGPLPAADEGIMDIKAHSVALVGEPRVLRRDATTGASTGALGTLPLLALLQANVDPADPAWHAIWPSADCHTLKHQSPLLLRRTWGTELTLNGGYYFNLSYLSSSPLLRLPGPITAAPPFGANSCPPPFFLVGCSDV